jgi:cytochrome c biogenesis protein CcdA
MGDGTSAKLAPMLLLVALVVSIGAVDSLNPSTVIPALLYALGAQGRRDVAAFTGGVFATSTVGGLVLVFGPGQALLAIVSHPHPRLVHAVEIGAGIVLVAVAVFLWLKREEVARKLSQQRVRGERGALLLGVAIMATELPTALPYFGALVAIVEGAHSNLVRLLLVLLYNIVFVAPLLVLLAVLAASGERGATIAAAARLKLVHYTPVLVPAALALLGVVLIVVGTWTS